jgi:DNA-binding GntR family transcriptional regulator
MTTQFSSLNQQISLSDQAYESIRKTISSGSLKAGERITERWLAQQLKVSPTPIREALHRLEQEGLLQRSDDRGLYIYEMSNSEIKELFYLVSILRGAAARIAATKITEAKLRELQDLVDVGESVLNSASVEEVFNNAYEFHNIIIQASENELLINFLDTANVFYKRYRLRAMEEGLKSDAKDLRTSLREHIAILDALRAHDADKVEQLTQAHIRRVGDLVVSSMESTSEGN